MSSNLDSNVAEDIVKALQTDPELKQTVEYLKIIGEYAKSMKYPINSFSELVDKIGNKSVNIDNRTVKASDLRRLIPAYYFPIVSKENFVEKANELRSIEFKRLRKIQKTA
jgi:hypothetical protein